jgi:hypothetical protein
MVSSKSRNISLRPFGVTSNKLRGSPSGACLSMSGSGPVPFAETMADVLNYVADNPEILSKVH